MSRHITEEKLNDYTDRRLGEAEMQEVARHLDICAECRSEATRLRELVAELGELPREGDPRDDLWEGIAAQTVKRGRLISLEARRALTRPRFPLSLSLPQAAAAMLAAAVISGGGVWLALRGGGSPSELAPQVALPRATAPVTASEYEDVVAELAGYLAQRQRDLDPATAETIDDNLRTIDEAIADIRRALADDPGNEFLNAYLARAMRQKADVLRHASSLVSRT